MNVLKFGGTSVGTPDSLRHVKSIVEGRTEPVIVVVSALGGVTDMLIDAARRALRADGTWHDVYDKIVERHRIVVDALIPEADRQALQQQLHKLLTRLYDYYRGIELVADLSERTLCNVVSFGERCSSLIVTGIIRGAELFYSPDFIKTECWFGRNIAVMQTTERRIRETFAKFTGPVAIVPGFISTDATSGDITNLGRGGSDYTAALIAATLEADMLEIWTDVDGFMTADPRIIHEATVIPHLSFLESMDLCNFGAKVIYPPTIYPVFHKNIPIKILNTFRPEAPGTLITDTHHVPVPQPFRGVSSIADVAVIELTPTTALPLSDMKTRALNVLTKQATEVLLTTDSESADHTLRIALRGADAGRAMQMLREEMSTGLKPDDRPAIRVIPALSTVTLVGENLKKDPHAAGRMLSTLRLSGIEAIASATGSSGFAMTAVLPTASMHAALKALHAAFLQ